MTDVHTIAQRSYNMTRIKSRDTKPELILRRLLCSKGVRGYRLNVKLPGKPDIVFTKYRTAIFIDGCFWHRCPQCFKQPENNRDFWTQKINGNVERDKKVNAQLKKQGWMVIRFWEHLLRKNPHSVFIKVKNVLKKGGWKDGL